MIVHFLLVQLPWLMAAFFLGMGFEARSARKDLEKLGDAIERLNRLAKEKAGA